MATFIRNLVSKEKQRYQQDGFDLDLSYVTPRLIAMGFPSDKLEGIYRNPMSEVKRFFLAKHAGHYKVYNLCSERSYSPKHFANATASFPFDDHNPCPFYLLIQFCEDARTYLDQSSKNVIAVHCKAGKGRTGLVLCCYLLFCKEQPTADAALKFYGEARTKDGKGVTIPSQIRWVRHFEEYLKKYRWANPAKPFTAKGSPIVITSIEIHGYPFGLDMATVSPCVRISLMANKTLVWDSRVHAQWKSATGDVPRWIKGDTRPYIIACEVQVCGDFHITCTNNEAQKIFGLWDHSTFLCSTDGTETKTSYLKPTLDGPAKDCKSHKVFPKDFHVVVVTRPLKPTEVVMADPEQEGEEKTERRTLQVNNPIRKLVSKKKLRYQKDGFDLDLSYITPTIIAMGFPSTNLEGMYRNKMSDVQKFLKYYHDGHFKVYNLCSERTYTPDNFGNSTASYPFDDHNPCPFKTLVKFCEDASDFHARDSSNCAVIHCKAGKGRTGLVISALLLHEKAASDAPSALQQYGAARTSNVKGVTIPSQRRYVHYYHEYLTNYAWVNRTFVYAGPIIRLTGFHMYPYTNFKGAGSTPNFKVSLMDKTVIYNHKTAVNGKLLKWTSDMPSWDCDCDVELQGDMHVVFYNDGEKMFGFWMNTTFIHSESIELVKDELDTAANDKKHHVFPKDFKCQVFFTDVKVDEDIGALTSAAAPEVGRQRTRTHTINIAPKPVAPVRPAEAFRQPNEDDEEDDEQAGYDSPSDHELSDDEYPEEEKPERDAKVADDHKKSPRVVELEALLATSVKEQNWDACIKLRDQIAKLKCTCGGYLESEQRQVCLTCGKGSGGVPTTPTSPTSPTFRAATPSFRQKLEQPQKSAPVRGKSPTPAAKETKETVKEADIRSSEQARSSERDARPSERAETRASERASEQTRASERNEGPARSAPPAPTSAPPPRPIASSPRGDTGKLEHRVQPKPVGLLERSSTAEECTNFNAAKGTIWGGMPCGTCGVQFKLHPPSRSPSGAATVPIPLGSPTASQITRTLPSPTNTAGKR